MTPYRPFIDCPLNHPLLTGSTMSKPKMTLSDRVHTASMLSNLAVSLIFKGNKQAKALEIGEQVGGIAELIADLVQPQSEQ